MAEPRYRYSLVENDPLDELPYFNHLFDTDDFSSGHMAFRQVMVWCSQKFGPPGFRTGRWVETSHAAAIWVRSEADAFEFRMRWC
jgi:hypothetical protein